MLVVFLKYLFSVLLILLSIAFFTLFERKILGYGHFRFGPNKLAFWGLFQPFSDALSLFSKEDQKSSMILYNIYIFSPFFGLFLVLLMWCFYSFWGLLVFSNFSFVFFIILSSMGVYFLLYSGWCSATKYSLLGSYRSSAQTISYEVLMILSFLFIVYLFYNMNFSYMIFMGDYVSIMFMGFILFFAWFISCLAECNRSPFDFSEGESELVSGFNTEYGGGLFSLIFIGEYGSIIFLSFLTGFLFFKPSFGLFFCLYISFFYLWVRCSYPRLRYDFLMMIAWSGLMLFLLSCFFCYVFYM